MNDTTPLLPILPPSTPAPPPEPVDTGPWYYAQLDATGACTSVTQASSALEGDNLVRIDSLDQALLGQTYDGDEWSPPGPLPPGVPIVTAQQFRDRFTDGELVAMLASADAGVKLLVLKVQTADPFPLDRASVQSGLDYLVAQGILTSERRDIVGSLEP